MSAGRVSPGGGAICPNLPRHAGFRQTASVSDTGGIARPDFATCDGNLHIARGSRILGQPIDDSIVAGVELATVLVDTRAANRVPALLSIIRDTVASWGPRERSPTASRTTSYRF